MRVFITGATGFVGSAIVQELLGAGHRVLGLARSDAGAASLAAAGADVHRGSLEDLESLKRGAAVVDGVIHTAFIHDFSDFAANAKADKLAIEAMTATLAGSGKPFLVTSGVLGLASGRPGTEEDSPGSGSPRKSEEAGLAASAQGVRAMVMRLSPSVHGDGDHGFVPALIKLAREKGFVVYVGEGKNRWPAVHRLDTAKLYRLALEKGTSGARFHGVADEGIPIRDIAEVIGRRLNMPAVSKTPEEAAALLGFIGHVLAMDCTASNTLTRERLGWHPTQPGLLRDLEHGRYFVADALGGRPTGS
jgi:nucleoside-diphosphate-sugar epimerase